MTRRLWLAPVLDLACITTFILVGAGRHNIDEGVDWFFEVLWPQVVGWYAVALIVRLYAAADRIWLRAAVTLAGATVIMIPLRALVLDRPAVSIFTVVWVAWMVLTTFGWRLVAWLVGERQRRRTATV